MRVTYVTVVLVYVVEDFVIDFAEELALEVIFGSISTRFGFERLGKQSPPTIAYSYRQNLRFCDYSWATTQKKELARIILSVLDFTANSKSGETEFDEELLLQAEANIFFYVYLE